MNSRTVALQLLLLSSALGGAAELAAPSQPSVAGRVYEELTPEHKRILDQGGQVFVSRDVEGSPWPAVTIYQFIAASPEAAAAVFIDYDRHHTYVPEVRHSRVSLVADPTTVEVDYVLRVPLVSDERYTVRNRLTTYHDGASYRIDWTLVRASSTKATTGHVRFEPHRATTPDTDGTIMAYSNFVTPGSRLARLGMIKRRALQQMRETAAAIAKRVDATRANDPALLEQQLGVLRAALRR